jgi:hypothetical protein
VEEDTCGCGYEDAAAGPIHFLVGHFVLRCTYNSRAC